ncbi:hypothetical protein [Modestobacter sp. SSW1-42]|uniref:hypothetical protein n=1 Tax=Modestobacter sp. SSW1-42 TaxID=596372 RepID=UPI0039865E40
MSAARIPYGLPTLPVPRRTVDERLDAIESDVAVIVKGIESILAEIVALRARWDADA